MVKGIEMNSEVVKNSKKIEFCKIGKWSKAA